MKKLLILVLLLASAIYAADNQSLFDFSALARTSLNNENTAQKAATNTSANSYFNQNSLASFNTLLNETPDAFKNSLLNNLPTSLKIYLVKALEFIKPYLNETSMQSLQRLQNILQQNIAATEQQEYTSAFHQSEQ